MSVYRRMIGRELPCGMQELLAVQPAELPPQDKDRLLDRTLLGQATPSETYLLANSYLASNEPGRAARCLTHVLNQQADDGRLRLALALAFEAMGRHDRAADQLGKILLASNTTWEHLPPKPAIYCAAGLQYERAGAWRSAIRRYTEALSLSPQEAFARHRLTAIHLAHGRFAQAGLHLRAILKHSPADKTARVCLAHLLQLAGQHDLAVWEYEQALCLEPDSWDLPADIAQDLIQSAGEGAIAILERLVKTQPHFPDLRMRLGNLYSQQGDDAAATAHYHRALSLHPEYLDCHIALARHELRMGRPNVAAEHFRRAIQINELNVETYVGLAMALTESGRAHQGTDIIASARRIGHNSAVLVAQLAMLERMDEDASKPLHHNDLHADRIEDLLRQATQTLVRHPMWNDVRMHCGLLQRMLGRHRQAQATFKEAVNVDGDCPLAWLQLGLSLSEAGDIAAARDAFARGLSFNARRSLLEYKLGLIQCGRIEFELALERLEQTSQDAVDANRRVWVAVDDLQLSGPTHRSVRDAGKPLAA